MLLVNEPLVMAALRLLAAGFQGTPDNQAAFARRLALLRVEGVPMLDILRELAKSDLVHFAALAPVPPPLFALACHSLARGCGVPFMPDDCFRTGEA